MKKKKLLMVDMDGTLVDTIKANHAAYQEALRKVGFDLGIEEYRENCDGRSYKDFLPRIVKDRELVEKVHDEKTRIYPEYMKHIEVNQFVVDIINGVRPHYYTALVTTASRNSVIGILELFNLNKLFDSIITQEDVKISKPDPDCYIKTMQIFDMQPSDCLIIEDSPSGVIAARGSGAKVWIIDNKGI